MAGKTISLSKYRWKKSAIPKTVSGAGDACMLSLEEIELIDETADDTTKDAEEDDASAPLDMEDRIASEMDFDSFIHIDEFKDSEPTVSASPSERKAMASDSLIPHATKKLKRINAGDLVNLPFHPASFAHDHLMSGDDPIALDDTDSTHLDAADADALASSPWQSFGLYPTLVKTLLQLGFTTPTDIQAQTLAHTLVHHRDVIGAAETGSGKTLAFGLPILHHLALELQKNPETLCTGLIIAPTRELAIQVLDHLKRAGAAVTHKIISIVGGMSAQKQRRLIASKPHIIIATPGRLWELIQEDDEFLDTLRRVKYLVIDEADRMLEAGHFKDLDDILAQISTDRLGDSQTPRIKRRTMVFSATMLEDDSIKKKVSQTFKKRSGETKNQLFNKLLQKINFHDAHPVYINLSTKSFMAKGLLEAKIECLKTEKDAMMYYVLCRYPGKTIVFVNSIDAIRRLVPIMTFLNVNVFGLHAEMQQRQRLKNLDRFRDTPNGVLVASDVASRGLDIPNVDHVIHYQLPRAADIYVHRSGRTARANSEGVSVSLVCPEELTTYKKICHTLHKDNGLTDFPVDISTLSKIKQRIQLAREIDTLQHKEKKVRNEREWFRKAAEEADILMSDDEEEMSSKKQHRSKGGVDDLDNDTHVQHGAILTVKERHKLQSLKNQLEALLAQPIIPRGVSSLYITSNSMKDLASRLMSSSKDSIMPAFTNSKATDDLRGKVRAHLTKSADVDNAARGTGPPNTESKPSQKESRRNNQRGKKRKTNENYVQSAVIKDAPLLSNYA
ncbi:hypothetical protein BASA61_009270 [Batrachochytrium salamandrivorans]|nr:hypothetical protein BASA61_009270 [Batrachochytrium salamandrivorans]